MPAQKRSAPRTQEVVFRVYSVPRRLRAAIKKRREESGLKLYQVVQDAVEHVDTIVDGIQKLSLETAVKPNRQVTRLPLNKATLDRLRRASQGTGVSSSTLLLACLTRSMNKPRRRGQKAAKGE